MWLLVNFPFLFQLFTVALEVATAASGSSKTTTTDLKMFTKFWKSFTWKADSKTKEFQGQIFGLWQEFWQSMLQSKTTKGKLFRFFHYLQITFFSTFFRYIRQTSLQFPHLLIISSNALLRIIKSTRARTFKFPILILIFSKSL